MIWRNVQTLVQAAGSCRGITAIIIPINQFVRIHKGTRETYIPEESLAATSTEKKKDTGILMILYCVFRVWLLICLLVRRTRWRLLNNLDTGTRVFLILLVSHSSRYAIQRWFFVAVWLLIEP